MSLRRPQLAPVAVPMASSPNSPMRRAAVRAVGVTVGRRRGHKSARNWPSNRTASKPLHSLLSRWHLSSPAWLRSPTPPPRCPSPMPRSYTKMSRPSAAPRPPEPYLRSPAPSTSAALPKCGFARSVHRSLCKTFVIPLVDLCI